jgi:hypothetical protein
VLTYNYTNNIGDEIVENRDEKAFIKDDKTALLGCINGILLYSFVL